MRFRASGAGNDFPRFVSDAGAGRDAMRASRIVALGAVWHARLDRERLRGFTILEVCVVLFIVAVLFVVAVPPAAHLLDEEKLQQPIRELQSFARTARRNAMLEDRAYEVLLLDDSYVLHPASKDNSGPDNRRTYELPADITFAIKRLADRDFAKHADARWIFSSNGLCEPLTFLFQHGSDWIRFRVDPLTATIQTEESYIQ
jgi:prepilin-type N-terminal cleavage/methylation domain-containing protein